MLQRIQSLYLSLTAILSLLFLKGSFLTFIDRSGSVIKVTFSQILRELSSGEYEILQTTFIISILIILIAVLSVISVMLFKNRRLQMLLVTFLIIIVITFSVLSGYYIYFIISKYDAEILPGLKMVIPLIQLILSILAFSCIRKDDDLVKSYDRLR